MTYEEIVRILDLALEQSRAEACNGCAFADTEEWEEPCKRCKRNYRDYWRRGKQNDKWRSENKNQENPNGRD